MAHIFYSDSDESDFSGFGTSDIDVTVVHYVSDVMLSDDENPEVVLQTMIVGRRTSLQLQYTVV